MDWTYIKNGERCSKEVRFAKKKTYAVNRKTLSKLYVICIRQILEYASEVWNNFSLVDCDKIEKVQQHAARIVTGLTILASRKSLYLETCWEPLLDRREKKNF